MKLKKQSALKDVVSMGVTNLVGVGLIGSTSTMVNALPAGDAKTFASVVPGLQSVALLSHNVGTVNKAMNFKTSKKSKLKFI